MALWVHGLTATKHLRIFLVWWKKLARDGCTSINSKVTTGTTLNFLRKDESNDSCCILPFATFISVSSFIRFCVSTKKHSSTTGLF